MKAGRCRLRNFHRTACSAALAVALTVAQPLLAVENSTGSAPTDVPEQSTHLERGFNNLNSLQLDKAIANFTAPLVAVMRKPLSDQANRQEAARYLVLIGTAFQFDENELAACQSYSLAHDLDPENRRALAGLISMLGRLGRHAQCEKLLADVSHLIGKDPILTAAAAGRARQRYNLPQATALYTRAAKLAPGNARIQFSLARSLSVQGRADEAAPHFRLAAQYCSSPYMAEMCLAYADELKQQNDSCRRHLLKAGTILPGDPLWRSKVAYHFAEKPQVWLDYFYSATQCRRLDSRVFAHLALYLAYDHRLDDALNCLAYPKRLRPWSSDLHLVTGKVYRASKNNAKAEPECRRALEINPYLAPAYRDLSELSDGKSQSEDPLSICLRGVSNCPGYWPGWHDVAVQFRKQKNWDKAIEAQKRSLQLVPSDTRLLADGAKAEAARAHAGLGTCYYKLNRQPEAIAEAKLCNELKFIPIRPPQWNWVILRPNRLNFRQATPPTKAQQAITHVALADMLREAGEFDDCCNEYRLAIALDPDNVAWQMCYFSALIEKKDWVEAMRQDLVLTNQLMSKAPQMLHNWNRWMEELQDNAGSSKGPASAPAVGPPPGPAGSRPPLSHLINPPERLFCHGFPANSTTLRSESGSPSKV